MSAVSLEELQGAPQVSAVAGLCRGHPAELETRLPPQMLGSCDGSGSLERLQREEMLLPDTQECDAAPGPEQGSHGSPQVIVKVNFRVW